MLKQVKGSLLNFNAKEQISVNLKMKSLYQKWTLAYSWFSWKLHSWST